MLIEFDMLMEKYEIPRGIIHIGAHRLQERDRYLKHGIKNIIWIEANKKIFNEMLNKISSSESIFNTLVSDEDNKEYIFKITNNEQSSSLLNLDKHKIYHPDVFVVDAQKLYSKRMDTLINEQSINIDQYNFLNIDIQGAELFAIKGFGDYIKNVDYIYTEINSEHLYEDCPLVTDIDEYLNNFNFKRVETKMTSCKWGDAFYVKAL